MVVASSSRIAEAIRSALALAPLVFAMTSATIETSFAASRTFVLTRENLCTRASCSVRFPTVRAGERMDIETVSCFVSIDGTATIVNPFIEARSDTQEAYRYNFDVPGKLGVNFGQGLYTANLSGFYPIKSGLTPNVFFFTDNSTFVRMRCTLAGKFTTGR